MKKKDNVRIKNKNILLIIPIYIIILYNISNKQLYLMRFFILNLLFKIFHSEVASLDTLFTQAVKLC